MNDSTINIVSGDLPLLISIPHLGTYLPEDVKVGMTPVAAHVADTDWHLDHLYDFSASMKASVISPCVSRYVIDLNRPPDGSSLYPGQTTTGLCPLETFHGEPLYQEGRSPDEAEIRRRIEHYWQPYHDALGERIQAIRKRHGYVLLWEAHSINSCLPRLFEGRLPDLNFGTADGRSCGAPVQDALVKNADRSPFSWVVNGRFKGGYITRNYGDPANGVHAVQLEMSQGIYMDETPPYNYRSELASKVRPLLESLLEATLNAAAQCPRPILA